MKVSTGVRKVLDKASIDIRGKSVDECCCTRTEEQPVPRMPE